MKKIYLLILPIVLSSCSSYDKVIGSNKYEAHCDDQVNLKLSNGMYLDSSVARTIPQPSQDMDFNSLLKPPIT